MKFKFSLLPLLFTISIIANIFLAYKVYDLNKRKTVFAVNNFHQVAEIRSQDTVFLGDSLTTWGDWNEFFPDTPIRNRGVPMAKISYFFDQLPYFLKNKPKKLFVLLGINDLHQKREVAEALEDYKKLLSMIHALSPTTVVYTLSLLPINSELYHGYANTDKIEKFNAGIKTLAQTFAMNYVDLNQAMKNEKGELKQDFTYDGIHLTVQGYKTWAQVLGPLL